MLEKVAIVTVIYNDPRDQFRNFINSLKQVKTVDFKLILVNNNQKIDWLKSETKGLQSSAVIGSEENLGFCAGSNLGIKKALSEDTGYVLLLNGDTTVSPDILRELLKYQKNNPKVGLLSPIITDSDNEKIVFYGGGIINRFFGYVRHQHMGEEYKKGYIKSGTTDFASGCCMLVKKEVFKKIGFLNEDYFIYFDDPDFSLRAQKAGFKVHILGLPLVSHINSSNKLNAKAAYYFGRNPFILIRNNFSWYLKPSAYLGQFLIRLPRNIFRLKNLDSFKNYFIGIFDGIIGRKG